MTEICDMVREIWDWATVVAFESEFVPVVGTPGTYPSISDMEKELLDGGSSPDPVLKPLPSWPPPPIADMDRTMYYVDLGPDR